MSDPAATLGSRLANRALEGERWAREALARHAGRTFSIAVGLLSTRFAIGADGAIEPAPDAASVPDLELVIAPLDVPRLLADPSQWPRCVIATGDAPLATTLQDLAGTLPWFVERAFASALGPVLGKRAADAGRALLAFPQYASARLADSVGSYVRDEAAIVTPGADARAFAAQLADVAARVDALAERVDRVSAAIDGRGPRPVS